MKVRLFYHSLLSDWNHGNAHFLRGVAAELTARGHDVLVLEREDNWSLRNLVADHGEAPLVRFGVAYPTLRHRFYQPGEDLRAIVADADLVLVHEWNPPALVRQIGELRREYAFVLLYHDTHHRLVSDPASVDRENLRDYDGVLAYGRSLRDLYLGAGLVARAWTWHEAADTRVFVPCASDAAEGELVWIGNWGDDEREAELHEFLINPARDLGLRARVYGVRYPARAREALANAGITYGGWLPNFAAPRVFARFKVTVHVPRRPYVEALPGIPTIRPFEALACGIPLISAPWRDEEALFTPGRDFLRVRDGAEMRAALRLLLSDDVARGELATDGLATIRRRHTCAHRVDELLEIHHEVRRREAHPRRVAAQAVGITAPEPEIPVTVAGGVGP